MDQTKSPKDHMSKTDLVLENEQLRSKVERLERQTAALAQANAYAAELVAKLDEANETLEAENRRRRLAEQQLQDIQGQIDMEVENRLQQLQSANEELVREVSDYQVEERHQSVLLKQLEDANQELTEFAYVVSHDLKAPLRGIKTLASWISEDSQDKLDEEGLQHLQLLLGRIDRMESLINGVLTYSRVGRATEPQELLDLNKLLENVIDMVSPPPEITVEVVDTFPTIQCGRTRLTQVFQNLISNAVKYIDKPEGRIEIGCEEQIERWIFWVSDNGPGIEEQFYEKIFKVFQTLTTRDEYESTGIGLAVVRKIVSQFGGQVWVESTLGQGSTFKFSWPKRTTVPAQESQVDSILESE